MARKLDKKFVDEMKTKLQQEKKEVETEIALLTNNRASKYEDIGPHDEDNATEISNYNDKKALQEELDENLKKIKNALKRIKTGDYGTCQKCLKDIPKNRLDVFPAAETCVSC